jgi:hypothetical protein
MKRARPSERIPVDPITRTLRGILQGGVEVI